MKLKIGDHVAYSAKFLRSVGAYCGPMGFARGKITYINAVSLECHIATIQWEKDADMPIKVNVANLAKVGTSAMTQN